MDGRSDELVRGILAFLRRSSSSAAPIGGKSQQQDPARLGGIEESAGISAPLQAIGASV